MPQQLPEVKRIIDIFKKAFSILESKDQENIDAEKRLFDLIRKEIAQELEAARKEGAKAELLFLQKVIMNIESKITRIQCSLMMGNYLNKRIDFLSHSIKKEG